MKTRPDQTPAAAPLDVAPCNTAAKKPRRFVRLGSHLVASRAITVVEYLGPNLSGDQWNSTPAIRLRLSGGVKLKQSFTSAEDAEQTINTLEDALQ